MTYRGSEGAMVENIILVALAILSLSVTVGMAVAFLAVLLYIRSWR